MFCSVTVLSYRANNVEDYFHILEAGATTALSDDREASLKMGSDLVSFLGMESANVKQLRDAIRNELSTADSVYMENSLMKKRVDAQGRTKSQELPMKIANSMPFNQIKPAIAEAKQTVANIIETFEDEYLNIEEVQTSEDEIVYEESDLKIEELGVTVCILPPKRDQQSSNTTALPEEVKKQ